MNTINFPTTFFNITTLKDRWDCDISTIQELAETGKLKCYIRPAALEISLENIPITQQDELLNALKKHHLDRRDIYWLFTNKNDRVILRTFSNQPPVIMGSFCDLVIPVEQVESFEQKYLHTEITRNDFKLLSNDFTCILWDGDEYKFGETQAKVIQCLWDAYENNQPWLYGKRILSTIGSSSERIKDIFRHNRYWRNIILADKKGKYRLNLSPKI